MPAPLDDKVRVKVRALRKQGKSVRAIAAELGISVGAVSALTQPGATADTPRPRAARKAAAKPEPPAASRGRRHPAPPPEASPPSPPPPVPSEPDELAAIEAELHGGDPDVADLGRYIERCERYLTTLEEAGNYSAVVQVQRMITDLVRRRREMRPPPREDPAEDVAIKAAARGAAERLRAIMDKVLAKRRTGRAA